MVQKLASHLLLENVADLCIVNSDLLTFFSLKL